MLGILALCTVAGYFFWWLGFNVNNIIMIYILGVLAVSMATTGRSYSLVSSLLSVLIFNFFFTHPYFTLMSDPGYLVTFGIMFIVALLVSSLTTRIKGQAILSANKAYRTEILLETSLKAPDCRRPRRHSFGDSRAAEQTAGTKPASVPPAGKWYAGQRNVLPILFCRRYVPLPDP